MQQMIPTYGLVEEVSWIQPDDPAPTDAFVAHRRCVTELLRNFIQGHTGPYYDPHHYVRGPLLKTICAAIGQPDDEFYENFDDARPEHLDAALSAHMYTIKIHSIDIYGGYVRPPHELPGGVFMVEQQFCNRSVRRDPQEGINLSTPLEWGDFVSNLFQIIKAVANENLDLYKPDETKKLKDDDLLLQSFKAHNRAPHEKITEQNLKDIYLAEEEIRCDMEIVAEIGVTRKSESEFRRFRFNGTAVDPLSADELHEILESQAYPRVILFITRQLCNKYIAYLENELREKFFFLPDGALDSRNNLAEHHVFLYEDLIRRHRYTINFLGPVILYSRGNTNNNLIFHELHENFPPNLRPTPNMKLWELRQFLRDVVKNATKRYIKQYKRRAKHDELGGDYELQIDMELSIQDKSEINARKGRFRRNADRRRAKIQIAEKYADKNDRFIYPLTLLLHAPDMLALCADTPRPLYSDASSEDAAESITERET